MKTPHQLRDKAGSLRVVAETVRDPHMRQGYLDMADQYDKLAKDAECERALYRHIQSVGEFPKLCRK